MACQIKILSLLQDLLSFFFLLLNALFLCVTFLFFSRKKKQTRKSPFHLAGLLIAYKKKLQMALLVRDFCDSKSLLVCLRKGKKLLIVFTILTTTKKKEKERNELDLTNVNESDSNKQ